MSEATQGSIDIAAAPFQVASVIADLPNYPSWTDGMGEPVVLESDGNGRPLLAEFDVTAGPIKDRVRLSYTWHEHAVEWELVKADALRALNGKYAWQAVGDATQVSYSLTIETASSLPGIVRKLAEKAIITSALQGLKRRVQELG